MRLLLTEDDAKLAKVLSRLTRKPFKPKEHRCYNRRAVNRTRTFCLERKVDYEPTY